MRFSLFFILIIPPLTLAGGTSHSKHSDHSAHHGHEGHVAMDYVDGTATELGGERFGQFVADQAGNQIAVVSVTGMVCDFCARGIEKTFQKDEGFKKIDVDLETGKVLIAFAESAKLVNQDIEQKILANGQTVTGIQILQAQ